MIASTAKQIAEHPEQHGMMVSVGPEEERKEKKKDDNTFGIVSYICGLNALGSWPWSVLVHIIKLQEEKEGTLQLQPGQACG